MLINIEPNKANVLAILNFRDESTFANLSEKAKGLQCDFTDLNKLYFK